MLSPGLYKRLEKAESAAKTEPLYLIVSDDGKEREISFQEWAESVRLEAQGKGTRSRFERISRGQDSSLQAATFILTVIKKEAQEMTDYIEEYV